MAHGGPARGEMGGGHQRAVWEQQKVHWFPLLGSLKNRTTGLIWLVTRVGGMGGRRGEVAHGGRATGEMGGHREQCGSNKSALVGSLKNLTTALIWLVTRVGGWGRWPMEGGQGGDQKTVWEQQWSDLAGDEGGGMGGGVGRWPMEGGQGGRWGGGAPESSVGATKDDWVP